jgi:hypothetical protein
VSLNGEGNPALATGGSAGVRILGVAGSLACRAARRAGIDRSFASMVSRPPT